MRCALCSSTEGELALLLECASNAGDQARVEAVLHRMSDNLNGLSDSAVELARRHFDRPQLRGEWEVQPSVRVDALGYCTEAGERVAASCMAAEAMLLAQLCSTVPNSMFNHAGSESSATASLMPSATSGVAVPAPTVHLTLDPPPSPCVRNRVAGASVQRMDLEESEWAAFADAVASLATKSEKRAAFDGFKEWLRRHGPFGVLIDGANVALYGQNFEEGGFSMGQVMQVWQQVMEGVPNARPLLVLHTRRQVRWGEAVMDTRGTCAAGCVQDPCMHARMHLLIVCWVVGRGQVPASRCHGRCRRCLRCHTSRLAAGTVL
jgi:hypothetical protein